NRTWRRETYGEHWCDKTTCTCPRTSTRSVLDFRLSSADLRYVKSTSRMLQHLQAVLSPLFATPKRGHPAPRGGGGSSQGLGEEDHSSTSSSLNSSSSYQQMPS